jgi:hypothetical protein
LLIKTIARDLAGVASARALRTARCSPMRAETAMRGNYSIHNEAACKALPGLQRGPRAELRCLLRHVSPRCLCAPPASVRQVSHCEEENVELPEALPEGEGAFPLEVLLF